MLENLVILTYARQASRMLTLQGIPVPESLPNLRDDVILERQSLPEQAVWQEVTTRASHVFGVTLQPLPTLANLQKLDTLVRELVTKRSGDVMNYVGKLRTTLPQICGGGNDLARFKTAAAMHSPCLATQQTRKPLELFKAIRPTQAGISPEGMGVGFKQALAIHRALDQVRLDVFERLARSGPG